MTTHIHDSRGRAYLRLSAARCCQKIELDDGFTCHPAGAEVLLQDDENGRLYFLCADGNHYIDGQADDGEHCVGVYPGG